MKTFDKEAVYDAEIAPLMQQIIDICKREEIPFMASAVYKNAENGADMATTHIPGPDGEFDRNYVQCVGWLRRGS